MCLRGFIDDYTSKSIALCLHEVEGDILSRAEEIRIRVGQPIYIRCGKGEYVPPSGFIPKPEDIEITVKKMSNYSVYAFNEEIRKGYLTLPGGYRVGICGTAVCDRGGVTTIRGVSSLNIRISREVKGCADKLIGRLLTEDGFLSTLIVSPPACGKTTLLRDIIRQVSNGGLTVGLVDERSEIAGTYMGMAQTDLGKRTDVLDACPKAEGMYMLLRSMGPRVIAADEIGSSAESDCIREIVNSGVALLCTVHAATVRELMGRRGIRELIGDRLFKRYIVLSASKGAGTVEALLDEELNELCL